MKNTSEKPKKLTSLKYELQMAELQVELVKLQEWIKATGQRVVVLFEGRDAAGKGGVIKRIAEKTNPRVVKVVALGTPSDKEKSQWYFQRYVQHLPSAGEMVLFDRSWYNRAGVESVMGFASKQQVEEFLFEAPLFEEMLIRSGIILIKYWFSVSDAEQTKRFRARAEDPTKFWKLSPMDLESLNRWEDYSAAKDHMFEATDTTTSPWWVVDADSKKNARLNCISHLLSLIPYEDMTPSEVAVPVRPKAKKKLKRPPIEKQRFVPKVF